MFSVFEHAEQASSRGVLEGGGATGLRNKGGGIRSNRLPGLVTKQQDVEFPQVLASRNTECCVTQCYSYMKRKFHSAALPSLMILDVLKITASEALSSTERLAIVLKPHNYSYMHFQPNKARSSSVKSEI